LPDFESQQSNQFQRGHLNNDKNKTYRHEQTAAPINNVYNNNNNINNNNNKPIFKNMTNFPTQNNVFKTVADVSKPQSYEASSNKYSLNETTMFKTPINQTKGYYESVQFQSQINSSSNQKQRTQSYPSEQRAKLFENQQQQEQELNFQPLSTNKVSLLYNQPDPFQTPSNQKITDPGIKQGSGKLNVSKRSMESPAHGFDFFRKPNNLFQNSFC
jgi:hypothetical protein